MTYIGSPWEKSDLISRRGLDAWIMSDAHDSAAAPVVDSSGFGRDLSPFGMTPTMAGVLNGKTAFNFATGRLASLVPFTAGVKHVFAVAAYTGATFADYAGLVSGIAAGDCLVGTAGTDKFFDNLDGSTTRRNDLLSLREAPVAGIPAFVEWRAPAGPGVSMDGFQIGRHRDFLGRFWVGPVWEAWAYTVNLTPLELLGLHRYIAMKYHLFPHFNAAGLKIFPFPTEWSRSLTAAKQVLMSRSISGKIKQRSKTTVAKRTIEASFDERRILEYNSALAFHTEHYGIKSFLFRDFTRNPAEDLEAYFAGEIQERPDGSERTSYGFTIAEK